MNYRRVYMKIIAKAKQEQGYRKKQRQLRWKTKHSGDYYEQHHVLPKSMFPLWNKRKGNLVLLTAREHFICHMLLNEIYPESNMFMALWRLANNKQNGHCIKGSRQYEQIRKQVSKKTKEWYKHNPNSGKKYYNNGVKTIFIKGNCPEGFVPGRLISEEHRNRLIEANKNREYKKGKEHPLYGKQISKKRREKLITCRIGSKHSDEAKKKMSEKAKGRIFSTETRKKLSDANKGQECINKGKRWFTDGKTNVMRFECPEGFKPGRSYHERKRK